MGLPNPHFYPAFIAGLSSITFILTWVVAISTGSVKKWPFHITEAASKNDLESGFFTLAMNICSLTLAVIVYLRFKEVQGHYRIAWVSRRVRAINRIALYIGWFSCGGFSIASCFPLTSIAAEDVHFVGALTGCGFGIIYLLLQVMSSWKLRGSANSIAMFYVRMSLALLAIYSVSMALVANVVAHCNGGGGGGGEGATGRYDNPLVVAAARLACRQTPSFRSAPNAPSLHHPLREEQEQERNWRIISSLHEWLLVCVFNAFYLTFTSEFRSIALDYPSIVVRISNYQSLDETEDTISIENES